MNYLELGKVSENKDNNFEAELSRFSINDGWRISDDSQTLLNIYNRINLHSTTHSFNFDEDYLFLFKYLPKLPRADDERYKRIKKYACKHDVSNKTDLFCTERFNCLKFELYVRNPKNVEAIEDIVSIHAKHEKELALFHDLIFERPTALEKHNIENFTKEDEEKLLNLAGELNEKAKNLLLIPYKHYNTDDEKFQHWGINSKIYEIINLLIKCFGLPIMHTIQVLNEKDGEKRQLKTTRTYYYHINRAELLNHEDYPFQNENSYVKLIQYTDTYFVEHIKKLNEFSVLVQSIQLAKPLDLDFMDYADNVEFFALNRGSIDRKVIPIHHYPDIGQSTKVNFEIDVSSGITNATKLFDRLYTSLQNNKELKIPEELNILEESDIFNILSEEEDNGDIADNLFLYDYYTYRLEQHRHQQKYLNDILNLKTKKFNELFGKLTNTAIYHELLKLNPNQTEDAIRKQIEKIKKAIAPK